ncbi:MAG: MOSC domain-containing protein [Candidatus Aminicenantales bacterium]|jgi:MOSC domain-containing protein YiiM
MTAGERGKSGQAGRASGTIASINVSRKKGRSKTPVPEAQVIAGEGIREDAHRGFGHRQVSLLMIESIEEQAARLGGGRETGIGPGAYAENLTTRGIDLKSLKTGDELLVRGKVGAVRLRVSQIGKECHTKCAIYKLAGNCIMPGLGIFCEVLEGGTVRAGDRIEKR